MKKLSLLLLLPIFLFSCSSDDNEADNIEPEQDYTSFTVVFNSSNAEMFTNWKAAYKNDKGEFIKIADVGHLKEGATSKEIKIDNNTPLEIFLFYNYVQESMYLRGEKSYMLTKNKTNNISFEGKGITVNPKDPTQYPQ